MPNPTWVVPINIRFNGTLDDAAVLKVDGDISTVVIWDAITAVDQQLLIDLVDAYGGDAPMAAPIGDINDLVEALEQTKAPNGEYLINTIPTKRVGLKPPTPITVSHSTAFLYYGGDPAGWRYLDDDEEFSGGGGGGGGSLPAAGSTDITF
jgi:hypothetical protein